MNNVEVYINDDYAVLNTENYDFYYGYEYDETNYDEPVYGFEVRNDIESLFRISYEKMQKYNNCPELSQCDKCLLFGIGLWLEHKKSGASK